LVEKDLTQLNFKKLVIVRPSLLIGNARPDFRLFEWVSIQLTKLINPILPKKYRSIKTKQVAKVLCAYATTPSLTDQKKTVLESNQLQNFR